MIILVPTYKILISTEAKFYIPKYIKNISADFHPQYEIFISRGHPSRGPDAIIGQSGVQGSQSDCLADCRRRYFGGGAPA